MNLAGKVAVVTGSGRGIGRQIALDLAAEGCKIVICSRNGDELAEVAEKISDIGGQVLPLRLDLSETAQIHQLADETVRRFGTIDILVNNAGIILPMAFLDTTLEDWDRTFDINVKALFVLSQRALERMKEVRSGYIINISSTVALGVPEHLASYGASKCAVAGISQALYETAKKFGIKVSTVYPGITDTEMVRNIDVSSGPEDWMLPEDISNCVLFLLKTSSRCIVKDMVPWSTRFDRI